MQYLLKMEDAPKLLKIPNRNVQTYGYVFHDTIGPNDRENENPVVRLEQNLYGYPTAGGDIVKDDSGAYAVFTEQGLSASQMTAAKVMDVE